MQNEADQEAVCEGHVREVERLSLNLPTRALAVAYLNLRYRTTSYAYRSWTGSQARRPD